jgi:hypothetical protein
MRAVSKWTMAVTLLWGAAYGQVPAANGTSDGSHNTGVGTGSLGGPLATAAGGENTATGFDALLNNAASTNSAFGAYTLIGNTSGSGNTALGNSVLSSNVAGGNNTATGSNALYNNDSDRHRVPPEIRPTGPVRCSIMVVAATIPPLVLRPCRGPHAAPTCGSRLL